MCLPGAALLRRTRAASTSSLIATLSIPGVLQTSMRVIPRVRRAMTPFLPLLRLRRLPFPIRRALYRTRRNFCEMSL